MGGGEEQFLAFTHFNDTNTLTIVQCQIKEVTSLSLCCESSGEMPDDSLARGCSNPAWLNL